MLPTEQIRPLHDVWLRPRRVFRELASRPVGRVDYLLGAAEGIALCLSLSRAENAGATLGLIEIFLRALAIGSIGGIASLFFMGFIYTRLGTRLGGGATRGQVLHVLAYGNVPVAASLIVWIFAALLTGEAAFEVTPRDVEVFVALLLRIQFITSGVLQLWSVIIQVMGLSEIQGLRTWRALGFWVLGRLIGVLTLLFLLILLVTLFPGTVPG